MSRLAGRAIVVTGAGSGIGRASVLRFAGEGGRVVVSDLDGERAAKVADEIEARGGVAAAQTCDVGDAKAVEALADACVGRFGSLDGWMNNAAWSGGRPLAAVDDQEWRAVQRVTLDGVFHGLRAALRHMLAAGGGAIVNVSSGAGLLAEAALGPYGAAKAGVISLTRSAALESAGAGVRVNCLCPGPIETPGLLGWVDAFPGGRPAFEAQLPQGRLGRPEEMAACAAFLLSDDASYVNGAVLVADGAVSSRLASPRPLA